MRALTMAAIASLGISTAFAAEPLVTPDWLGEQIESGDVVVLDVRNRIDGGSAVVFRAGHIPGAVYSSYLDDGWRVDTETAPGMLPPVESLESLIGNLGIGNDDHVVVVHGGVNASDFGSAARIYWTFNYLGHEKVSILDGGYAAWTEAGLPVATGASAIEPDTFSANPQPQLLASAADVEAVLADGSATLVDGRPDEQFTGKDKHPAAARAGHIPGAHSFAQTNWFEDDKGSLKDVDSVLAALPAGILDADKPVVSYCNTGHWAATNWFMLSEVAGKEDVKLYDGSMTEWAADPKRPVAAGAAN